MSRRRILSVLGLAVAVALAVWVVMRAGDLKNLAAVFRGALNRPGWLLLGVSLLGVSLLAGTLRWWLLLGAFWTPLPFREVVRLYLAGHFCSIFATGATGGDVVKAAVVAARFPGRRLAAIASIGVERVIGLLSLAFPLGLAQAAVRRTTAGTGGIDMHRLCLVLSLGLFAAWCLAAVVLCVNGSWLARRMPLRRRFPALCGRLAPLAAVWEDIRRVCFRRNLLCSVLWLSILNHVVAALCGVAMARAAGADVPLLDAASAMLLSNAVAMVPLTPGGVGLREATAAELLRTIGATPAQASATGLLVFGAILVWAAIGAVAWFALRRKRPAP